MDSPLASRTPTPSASVSPSASPSPSPSPPCPCDPGTGCGGTCSNPNVTLIISPSILTECGVDNPPPLFLELTKQNDCPGASWLGSDVPSGWAGEVAFITATGCWQLKITTTTTDPVWTGVKGGSDPVGDYTQKCGQTCGDNDETCIISVGADLVSPSPSPSPSVSRSPSLSPSASPSPSPFSFSSFRMS